jgi:hypothetical protein
VIDWDGVSPIPLKVSAISIAQSFFGSSILSRVDDPADKLFLRELTHLNEQNSQNFSSLYKDSAENKFLFDLIHFGGDFRSLEYRFPLIMQKALRRSPENLRLAASLWTEFSERIFLNRNLQVPDWRVYVEIQEALGIFGKLRRWKRWALKYWNVFWRPRFSLTAWESF